jgi:hypothetical protein
MNGTHERHGQGEAAVVAAGWLIPMRTMFVLAWAFNVVILAALFWSAWRNNQSEKLLCMGFLLVWLVGPTVLIALRSWRRRPVVRIGT